MIYYTILHSDIHHVFSCRPNQVAEKVAARISENFSEAAIVMVIIYNGCVLMDSTDGLGYVCVCCTH